MKQLPDNFYAFGDAASMTINAKDLRELLLNTDGKAIIKGRLRDIKAKHLGAGVYRVTLAPLNGEVE